MAWVEIEPMCLTAREGSDHGSDKMSRFRSLAILMLPDDEDKTYRAFEIIKRIIPSTDSSYENHRKMLYDLAWNKGLRKPIEGGDPDNIVDGVLKGRPAWRKKKWVLIINDKTYHWIWQLNEHISNLKRKQPGLRFYIESDRIDDEDWSFDAIRVEGGLPRRKRSSRMKHLPFKLGLIAMFVLAIVANRDTREAKVKVDYISIKNQLMTSKKQISKVPIRENTNLGDTWKKPVEAPLEQKEELQPVVLASTFTIRGLCLTRDSW